MITDEIQTKIDGFRDRYGHMPTKLRLCPANYYRLKSAFEKRIGQSVTGIREYQGMEVVQAKQYAQMAHMEPERVLEVG